MEQQSKFRGAVELVGIVAVVASLIFVGLEIRQNTVASRASAIQESINVARQYVQVMATDPELNRIVTIGNQDLSGLSAEERSRYGLWFNSFLFGMQGLHEQWRLGVLPDGIWGTFNTIICGNMEDPGRQALWPTRQYFSPSFVEMVNSCEALSGQ